MTFSHKDCEVPEVGWLCFLSDSVETWLPPKKYIRKTFCRALSHLGLLFEGLFYLNPPPPPNYGLDFDFREEKKDGKTHSKYLVSFESMCYSQHLQVLGVLK